MFAIWGSKAQEQPRGSLRESALNAALFPLDKSGLLRHGAAMAEKQGAEPGGHKEKASSRARRARLEKALRDNLRRRKDQAREKKQVQDEAAPAKG